MQILFTTNDLNITNVKIQHYPEKQGYQLAFDIDDTEYELIMDKHDEFLPDNAHQMEEYATKFYITRGSRMVVKVAKSQPFANIHHLNNSAVILPSRILAPNILIMEGIGAKCIPGNIEHIDMMMTFVANMKIFHEKHNVIVQDIKLGNIVVWDERMVCIDLEGCKYVNESMVCVQPVIFSTYSFFNQHHNVNNYLVEHAFSTYTEFQVMWFTLGIICIDITVGSNVIRPYWYKQDHECKINPMKGILNYDDVGAVASIIKIAPIKRIWNMVLRHIVMCDAIEVVSSIIEMCGILKKMILSNRH